MADEHERPSLRHIALSLVVNFGDKRACGIQRGQIPCLSLRDYRTGNAVSTEDHDRLVWHFAEVLNKARALLFQAFNHMSIVNNLVPDVDGSAILGEGTLHDFDCADNAGAETTGLSEDDLHIL